MKILGAELNAWITEDWPGEYGDEFYWDHDLFGDEPDHEVTYDTDDLGPAMYQGDGQDPTGGEGHDVAKLIRRWRKARGKKIVAVAVPDEKMTEFKAYLKTIGGALM